MKRVLVVDDDISFLQGLTDGFKAYENQFSISTANDGLEAVEVLEKEQINLVLTDLKMPRMDGFELVAHLSSNYSSVPVIVMTAFGTPEMEASLREIGTIQYIEKPIDFSVLVEKILKGIEEPKQGYITGVSLSSFLQLLEIDKKTCTLTVHAGEETGYLHFKEGDLLDANHANQRGSEAAYEIVSWKNVEIAMDSSCSLTEKNIPESLGFILLEGTRRKDELDAEEQQPSPASLSQETGSLDSLNMEDIDLAFSDDDEEPTLENEPTAQQSTLSQSAAHNPVLIQFIAMLSSFPEIEGATVSAKDGTILHQSGASGDSTANFITYVAVAAEQVRTTIGASGAQYSAFSLTDSSKLIVICGPEVIVGLKVGSAVFPAPIADGLRPILSRISLTD
ncbi:MAG: response regulator [Thermodesulfobacteriota bacterium]